MKEQETPEKMLQNMSQTSKEEIIEGSKTEQEEPSWDGFWLKELTWREMRELKKKAEEKE